MGPDFSGYVTRYGIKCTDGRVIQAQAFKHNDGAQIPLVWQHQHDGPGNVLGHLILRHVEDGVRGDGYFNATPAGQQAKELVVHKDIQNLSIYANQLKQQGNNVTHGNIREGSLVLAGANPGAYIDNVYVQHGDGTEGVADGEVIIYTDSEIELVHADAEPSNTPKPTADNPDPDRDGDNDLFDPADGGLGPDATVQDVLDTLTDVQKEVVVGLVGAALNHSDDTSALPDGQSAVELINSLTGVQKNPAPEAIEHSGNPSTPDQKGDSAVSRNVFDQTDADKSSGGHHTLSHSDVQEIFTAARKSGNTLKDAVEQFALSHGIDDISTLFPYDQAVTDTPEFISRRMEWVAGVLNAVRKTPFSRIRSWTADLTLDEARAKGYVTGAMKKEEYFAVAKRITTPVTIYKKQKLDRDDVLDITDFNVVTWLQTEMRIMLDEELARAILVGDGRQVDDPDKIDPTHVRPIYGDDQLYVTTLNVDLTDASSSADEIVDAVVTGMRFYRGSGNPVMYTTLPYMSKMLLAKDTLGRRLYPTKVELAAALGVSDVIPCEALEATSNLIGIIVNLLDYTCGADKGGEVSMFDFFDIDFNQFKYLMETRMSGAMTKYKGALTVLEFTGAGGMLANPPAPTFNTTTGVGTIPTVSNVSYVTVDVNGTESAALTPGAQTAIASGTSVHYRAKAAATYSFPDNGSQDWTFSRA